MSPSKRKQAPSPLHVSVAIPVTLVLIGALALAGAGALENMRFSNATAQILRFVDVVRGEAVQGTFAPAAGRDMFDELRQAGQVVTDASRLNPWGGQIRAVTASNSVMQLVTDVPTRDCRRLALYFLDHAPADMGLQTIAAASVTPSAQWAGIYPASGLKPDAAVAHACDGAPYAHLALVFRFR